MGVPMDEFEARIARLLTKSARLDGRVALTPDTPLLEGGLELDSVELLELVVAIEEAFGTTIEDNELTPELFVSIGSLGRFVKEKCGGRHQDG